MKAKVLHFCFLTITAFLVVFVATGCGGKKNPVPKDAVAVIHGKVITRASFLVAMQELTPPGGTAPQPGTAGYRGMEQGAATDLIERAIMDEKALAYHIVIPKTAIDHAVQLLIKQNFKGNVQKFNQYVTLKHFSVSDIREYFRVQLLAAALRRYIIRPLKVTTKDIATYYQQNRASTTVPPSRNARDILVKNKSLADTIYRQLKSRPDDFSALVRQYSIDKATKKHGVQAVGGVSTRPGNMTETPEYYKTVFKLATGAISKPVNSVQGWYIIQATSKIIPAHRLPLDATLKVKIRGVILKDKISKATTAWRVDVEKIAKKDAIYQKGFPW